MDAAASVSQRRTDADRPERLNDPDRWVEDHGDALFRYAFLRVRNRQVAEDLVQDTLLAGLKMRSTFRGQASERSWLCGILKHKVIDHFRILGRERPFSDLAPFDDENAEKFSEGGYWDHARGPQEWGDGPDEAMNRAEFWPVLHGCLKRLPQKWADVFLLREVEQRETGEICDMLRISPNNLWVILHRARMGLRDCLETRWFSSESKVELPP